MIEKSIYIRIIAMNQHTMFYFYFSSPCIKQNAILIKYCFRLVGTETPVAPPEGAEKEEKNVCIICTSE